LQVQAGGAEKNTMRHIAIVTSAVWIAVIVALFGATAMIAKVPQRAEAAAISSGIDMMQMTRDAKNLRIEQFDAN
jgi:hypothetical protein